MMKPTMRKNNDAVSPVIGVMLMLVVTIIIAAVVSGFAGGLAEGAKAAPQASIAVKTGYGYNFYGTAIDTNNFDISFEHLSGDPIPTKDIEIITYLTLPNGTVVQHKQTANSPVVTASYPTYTANYVRVPFIYDSTLPEILYHKEANITAGMTSPHWFGEYTLMPGQVARTYKIGGTAAFLGLVPENNVFPVGTSGSENRNAYDEGIAVLRECIDANSPLEIKWLHVPSGKYILNKQITLQG